MGVLSWAWRTISGDSNANLSLQWLLVPCMRALSTYVLIGSPESADVTSHLLLFEYEGGLCASQYYTILLK